MIVVGDPAPDAVFASPGCAALRLSDFWRDRPAILLFLRHFG